MVNFTHGIRKYLPNDPYYYEVDNIPIEQLQNNTVHNLDRIIALEGIVFSWATQPWVQVWLDAYFSEIDHNHNLQELSNVSEVFPVEAQMLAYDTGTLDWIPSSLIIPNESLPIKDTFIFEETKFTDWQRLFGGGNSNSEWGPGQQRKFVLENIPPGDRIHTAFAYFRFTNIRAGENGFPRMYVVGDNAASNWAYEEVWPRVSLPAGGGYKFLCLHKDTGDDFISNSYECMLPIRYDSATDEVWLRIMERHAGQDNYLVFENYGELQFTGQYVTKKKKEVVIG